MQIANEEIYSSLEMDYRGGITLTRKQVKFVVVGELVLLFVAFALGAGWASAAFGFNFF